jgi:hypothetical protein
LACLALLCFLAPASSAQINGRTPPGGFGGVSPQGGASDTFVTVVVSVRELTGAPLQGSAVVKLSSDFRGIHLTAPTQDAGAATFPSVRAGEYQIEVSSVGYKTKSESTNIMAGASTYNVYFYMQSESATDNATCRLRLRR